MIDRRDRTSGLTSFSVPCPRLEGHGYSYGRTPRSGTVRAKERKVKRRDAQLRRDHSPSKGIASFRPFSSGLIRFAPINQAAQLLSQSTQRVPVYQAPRTNPEPHPLTHKPSESVSPRYVPRVLIPQPRPLRNTRLDRKMIAQSSHPIQRSHYSRFRSRVITPNTPKKRYVQGAT